MKYIRKIVALLIAVVLLAAVCIGIGVIYAVKNVNVTLVSYTYETDSAEAKAKLSEFKNRISDEVRGTMLSFVKKESISSSIKDGSYFVYEFKKVYPCTLEVTLKERREIFMTENSGGGYTVYDENGDVLRSASNEDEAANADGLLNLCVEGTENADLKNVASICTAFAEKFKSIRAIAESAYLTKGIVESFTFNFRCGIKTIIYDYTQLTAEKIDAVYNCFSALPGDKKICGEIHCVVDAKGQVVAEHKN